MWWPNLDDWKRNLARDNHPTIDLNLIQNQLTCLNASITLSKLPIMMQTQIQATNMRWGGTTLKSLQPCLILIPNTTISHSWLSHYNWQTEMWWPSLYDWKRNLAKDDRPTIDLNLMWDQSPCLNASITLTKLPIMMQTQIQATNMRWGETTLKSLQPCLVPMPNTTIGHSWLSHYNCQTKMWWPNSDDWKRNLARDNRPTIALNLMQNQSTCLNASITLTKLPRMMQIQIRATKMRWGGTTLKVCNPVPCQCPIQLSATVDSHTIIAKQKCDDQIWMTGREIMQEMK